MSGFLSSRAALPVVAAVAALLGAGATWLVQKPANGSIVRDYLLEHPEVLPEAMQRLRERETLKTIADNRADIVMPTGTAWVGNPKGDVTVVEYIDYNCGYCRASVQIVDQLVAADPGVKIVYREWPVLSSESVTAARYGLAVARTGGNYRKLHDALYAGGPLSDASMDAALRTAGADPAKIKAALAAPEVDEGIRTNMGVMTKLGQQGTPSWIIGNQVYSGLMTLDQMKDAVATARKNKAA